MTTASAPVLDERLSLGHLARMPSPALSSFVSASSTSNGTRQTLKPVTYLAPQVVLTVLGFLLQFSFVIFTVFSNMSTNQQRFSEDAPQPSDFVKVCPDPCAIESSACAAVGHGGG